MLFNSFTFLIFFLVVTPLYFVLPHRFRWIMLLIASCFFYMFFKFEYILILFFTIIVDYYAGIFIAKTNEIKLKRFYLMLSLAANIGVLAIFKYYNFINENISDVLILAGIHNPIPFLKMILPIGLSFHTFQAMSYTIEVYRGAQKPEKHFGIYSLYVMFYPQLVAGPIERPQNLIHQFYEEHYLNYSNLISGLQMIFWGIFKKVVIADRLAIIVDYVYANPHKYHGASLIITIILYSFQIYCDFSGYSEIAIGSAKVMGFDLMTNFNYPYRSKNVTEFWRRWHISLNTWFKDYLYIPLGGSKGKTIFHIRNVIIVFFLSGLWHGASWTFIIWGVLHGVASTFEVLTKKYRANFSKTVNINIYNSVSIILTFSFCTLVWIFFRAPNFSTANYVLTHLFSGNSIKDFFSFSEQLDWKTSSYLGIQLYQFIGTLLLIPLLLLLELFICNSKGENKISTLPIYFRWAFYYLIIFSILIFGVFDTNQFIYFQF